MIDRDALVKRLQELESVATQGMWTRIGFSRIPEVSENGIKRTEDADFIVALRNAWPAILAILTAPVAEIGWGVFESGFGLSEVFERKELAERYVMGNSECSPQVLPLYTKPPLPQSARTAREDVIEECAKVCEQEICSCCWNDDAQAAAEHCAAAIRSLAAHPAEPAGKGAGDD